MKSAIAITSTLAFFANAQLSYDAHSKTIKCPLSTGTFCVGPASGLIVSCTNGVGTVSPCDGGLTCSQTSPTAGDAACSATPKWSISNSTKPCLVDAESKDCNCETPSPVVSSSALSPPPPPPPSSWPVGPIFSSRWANSSTSTPWTTTSASTPVSPVVPSSTPCETTTATASSWEYIPPPSSTPVAPVIPPSSLWTTTLPSTPVGPVIPSKPTTSHYGPGTGTGYPQYTSKVTTLNSSWKPTLTASSSPTSSTIASPVQATGGAMSGKGINALALGLFGLAAALA